jgi:hypothetical protein
MAVEFRSNNSVERQNGSEKSEVIIHAALIMSKAHDVIALSPEAAFTDLQKLLSLNIGKPGEPGEPILWNDPRLGPLWPAEPPEWYVRVEQACQELEEQLGQLRDPKTQPDDVELHPQIEEWRKLEAMYSEGKLDEYRGEFVIWGNGEIFAHGRKLLSVRLQAEKLAEVKGISRDQLIDYFVAGE